MNIEYDPEVDGAYVWLVDNIDTEGERYEREVWPKELAEEIGVLFDRSGKILGFEIQPASKYLAEELLTAK
jgi:uncharacterized protein YuzE